MFTSYKGEAPHPIFIGLRYHLFPEIEDGQDSFVAMSLLGQHEKLATPGQCKRLGNVTGSGDPAVWSPLEHRDGLLGSFKVEGLKRWGRPEGTRLCVEVKAPAASGD